MNTNPTVNDPSLLRGICGHCQAPITTKLLTPTVANLTHLSMAIYNHPILITCAVCHKKSTLICTGVTMSFSLQPLTVEEVEIGITQGMIDPEMGSISKIDNVTLLDPKLLAALKKGGH